MMSTFHDEPVRGVIGNVGALKFNGLEATRMFIRNEIAPPPIHHLIGLRPTSVGPGTVTWSMPITPWLMESNGIIFGGVYALFADAPLGGALYTNVGPGKFVTTTDISISYVRPATIDTGNLIARATTVHAGRGTGISEVHVEDRYGRLMAHGTTRCVIIETPYDPDAELMPIPPTIDDPPDPHLRPIPVPTGDLSRLINTKPLDVMRFFIDNPDEAFGPVGALSGATPVAVEDGHYSADVPASPWFSAGMPTMYGGAIAWALDSVMTGAIYSSLDPGAFMANLDLKVRYLRPAFLDGGSLHMHGEVVHRGRSMRTARSEMTDANGKRVALATASAMVLPTGVADLMKGGRPDEIVGI